MCKNCSSENIKVKEYINYQTGEKLDLERVSQLKDNAMLKVKPELWCIWNFEKNNKLDFDIWKMTKGLGKKAWWYCTMYNDSYPMPINKKASGRGCSICSGYYIVPNNSLASLNPQLASQWHPIKNENLTPYDIIPNHSKKVWWLGECGHEWEATPHNRTYGTNCPYCAPNPKVLKGFNDLWTTHPYIAELLIYPEDGYVYSYGSLTIVKWRCPDCLNKNSNTIVDLVNGASCKSCSDNISIGEKFIYSLLNELYIEFVFDSKINWSNNRRFDFYIPSLNVIIETHGEQHYLQTNRKNARTLQEEQYNDEYKCTLAIQNGVKPEDYIVIDCRYSNFEYIKNNVLNSRLSEIFNLNKVDFSKLNIVPNKFTLLTWKYWNNGLGVMEISRKTSLSKRAILSYLKLGKSLGKCDYNTEDRYTRMSKVVLKINREGIIVEEYESLKTASKNESFSILKFPFNKKTKSGAKFIYVYEEDYKNYQLEISQYIKNFNIENTVCQLNIDSNVVLYRYSNIKEVCDKNENYNFSNIYACCKNKVKSSYGFKWMYLKDYEKLIQDKSNDTV